MAHQGGFITGWRAALAVLDNQVVCRAALLVLVALTAALAAVVVTPSLRRLGQATWRRQPPAALRPSGAWLG